MEEFTIGQFSKLAGVNKETIRYYETLGLLPPPEKRQNGYRVYTLRHVETMEAISLVKDSGFSLKEVKNIITLQEDETPQNDVLKDILSKKIDLIEKKIQDLSRLKKGLEKVVNNIENYNMRTCIEIKKNNID
jgi:DNA-binding transcriptional MerR regulator